MNPKLIDIIEKEKSFLLEELDSTYSQIELSNISNISDEIEKILKGFLQFILKKYSKDFFNLKSNEQNLYLLMEEEQKLYTLKMEADILQSNTLLIFIEPLGIKKILKKDLKKFPIKIKSYGRIKQVILIYPKDLKVELEYINSLIQNTLLTGYNWFKNKIVDLIKKEEISLSDNLYNYIKTIITSEELRKNLWFASITKGYGFRLIERDVALNLFDIIDKTSDNYGDSTNKLVSEMLSTKLPSEQLLMQKAIENNAIIDAQISDASYYKNGNIYAAAMGSLYDNNIFTIHPIYISNNANVLLLYPTENREIIEPIIEHHKNKLEDISKKSLNLIYKSLNIFNSSNSMNTGKLGEFFGGFFRGILDLNT